MAKTLKQILEESTSVAKKAAKVAGLPEFKPGYVDTSKTIQPQVQNALTGASPETPTAPTDTTTKGILALTPKDLLLQKMTSYFEQPAQPSLEEQYKTLSTEKGLEAKRQAVGTFDEEVNTTLNLLADLRKNIQKGTTEAFRGGVEAQKRTGLIEQLGTLERGQTAAQRALTLGETEVSDILGLRKEERKRPLEELKSYADIYKTYQDIANPKPTERELDTFTDEKGNRISTLYDEKTGETRQINLGKAKAEIDKMSDTEKSRQLRSEIINRAETVLTKSTGTDGFVDPKTYAKLKAEYAGITGNSAEFDDLYSYLLSPAERTRLGITKETKGEPSWLK